MVRGCARRNPSVLVGRPHGVVGAETAIYGLARLFQMCRKHVHGLVEVVHTLEEAYKIVEVCPGDFMQRL